MKKALFASAIAGLCMTFPAVGESWSCRNFEFEIACSSDACEAAESFTPMDIHLSRSTMSVCAYTGCWEGGPTAVLESGRFLTFTGEGLPFSTQPDSGTDVSATLDRETLIATLLVGGSYALPLRCAQYPLSDSSSVPSE